MITLTKDQAFELKMLRDRLQNEVGSEAEEARRLTAEQGSSKHYRTSDKEREAQRGLDVVNSILKQHEQGN